MQDSVVIGAGPAGLMAAEMLADAGHKVTIYDAMPSVGRKFLMAGKSGLNLTKDEPFDEFVKHYHESGFWLRPILKEFGNQDVIQWARDLGQEVFTGSTGRVFPAEMKAGPLLRAWLARLATKGVTFNLRLTWSGWIGNYLLFESVEGPQKILPRVAILCLGGASWAKLGSTGTWAEILSRNGIHVKPFQPDNVALRVDWSPYMRKFFGTPVKAVGMITDTGTHFGEFVISEQGLEGGGIYSISNSIRAGSNLALDLKPDRTLEALTASLSESRGKETLSNHLRKAVGLNPVKIALLNEFAYPLPRGARELASLIKRLDFGLLRPGPLDGAISTAGGVALAEFDDNLMLRKLPGVFCAGEMLDWEAPTGGYLLTASLSTGRWAGLGAVRFCQS